MEEGQERDSSSDETRVVIIEDEDMEDSPTDTPDFWMPKETRMTPS